MKKEIEKPTFYLIGVPATGNLGDHALGVATVQFIKDIIADAKIVCITSRDFLMKLNQIKKNIKPYDIILYYPGGNMGNQYIDEEYARQEVILNFPNNAIICLPQTVYFSENNKDYQDWFSWELENTIKYPKHMPQMAKRDEAVKQFKAVYPLHKNLYIFARDFQSYQTLRDLVPECKIYLTPDMVTTFEYKPNTQERKFLTYCIRKDCESVYSDEEKLKIKKLAEENVRGSEIKDIDTVFPENLDFRFNRPYLEDLLKTFSESKLVVTDRLHGLIFAAITNTPCIALLSYNHKIAGAYEWLKELDFLNICKNIEEYEWLIEQYPFSSTKNIKELNIKKKFKSLVDILKTTYDSALKIAKKTKDK